MKTNHGNDIPFAPAPGSRHVVDFPMGGFHRTVQGSYVWRGGRWHRISASPSEHGTKAANHSAVPEGSGFPPAAHHDEQGKSSGQARKPKSRMSYYAEVALMFAFACFLEGVRMVDELWSGK